MATIPYQAPQLVETGTASEPNVYATIAANGGQTLTDGDFAILSSNKLSKAAANAAVTTIAGLVFAGNDSLYTLAGGAFTRGSSIFGPDQSGNALVPGTNQCPRIIGLSQVELWISLIQSTTLAASLVGTQVGLNYDATSGYFFADPAQTNKIAQIVEVSAGPDSLNSSVGAAGISNGVLGDSGGRVKIQFLSGLALL